jgi:hypothetical protein
VVGLITLLPVADLCMSMDSTLKLKRWTCEHGHKRWFLSDQDPNRISTQWAEIHDSDWCEPDKEQVPVKEIEEELF